mmetsp:Transcript_10205/g.22641  ORF Transcript_10205/g.22641 Transcript_10205/m.22641 type:complete len:295 (-) Transcript_10205:563-1447(-)
MISATAAVFPPAAASVPAEARKRRRTIMRQSKDGPATISNGFTVPPDVVLSSATDTQGVSFLNHAFTGSNIMISTGSNVVMSSENVPISVGSTGIVKSKARKTSKHQVNKAPQKRYDPDVPMSKEHAAEWRREQRRKRNRESAAASRKKTRDRITDLESIVMEMQRSYEAVVKRLRKYEPDAFSEDVPLKRTTAPLTVSNPITYQAESCVTPSPPLSPKDCMSVPTEEHSANLSIVSTEANNWQNHLPNQDSFRSAESFFSRNDDLNSKDAVIQPMTEEGVEGLIALATSCMKK